MIHRARLRLLAYITVVLTLVLLAAGSLVYVLLSRQLDGALDDRLHALAAPLIAPGSPSGVDGAESLPPDSFIVRVTGNRKITRSASTPEGLPDLAAMAALAKSGRREDVRTIEAGGQRYRLLTTVVALGPGAGLVTQVGISTAERERQQWLVRLALAGGGGLGLGLTLLGAFFLTGRALAPVQASIERQRRFVSDASHELRTPLALLRLELEGLPASASTGGEATRPLIRQVDRLSRLVDDLLLLARLDEGALPLEREPVAVEGLIGTAAAEARRLAPSVAVTAEVAPDLWVEGDAGRLHQALLVLVDNAARVTPLGGAIALAARREGDRVAITVADSGPGIDAEHAAHVFERFYRVDRARARAQGGAGLGLAIASEIARAHGGVLRLVNPGERGAVLELGLPALDLAHAAALVRATAE